VQGVLLKYPKGFIVSEVNSETEQARDLINVTNNKYAVHIYYLLIKI
jgi:hypothetical protein